jgi:hypothetical protein
VEAKAPTVTSATTSGTSHSYRSRRHPLVFPPGALTISFVRATLTSQ